MSELIKTLELAAKQSVNAGTRLRNLVIEALNEAKNPRVIKPLGVNQSALKRREDVKKKATPMAAIASNPLWDKAVDDEPPKLIESLIALMRKGNSIKQGIKFYSTNKEFESFIKTGSGALIELTLQRILSHVAKQKEVEVIKELELYKVVSFVRKNK